MNVKLPSGHRAVDAAHGSPECLRRHPEALPGEQHRPQDQADQRRAGSPGGDKVAPVDQRAVERGAEHGGEVVPVGQRGQDQQDGGLPPQLARHHRQHHSDQPRRQGDAKGDSQGRSSYACNWSEKVPAGQAGDRRTKGSVGVRFDLEILPAEQQQRHRADSPERQCHDEHDGALRLG